MPGERGTSSFKEGAGGAAGTAAEGPRDGQVVVPHRKEEVGSAGTSRKTGAAATRARVEFLGVLLLQPLPFAFSLNQQPVLGCEADSSPKHQGCGTMVPQPLSQQSSANGWNLLLEHN